MAKEMLTLSQVNRPPAETWNYLHINETSFAVAVAEAEGEVYARLPRLFEGIASGLGAEADAWIANSAGDARFIELHPDSPAEPVLIELGDGQMCDTGVLVREGVEAELVVCAHPTAAEGTSASLLRVFVERGAKLRICELVAAGDGTQHIDGIGIHAEKDASVEMRQYALGGARVALGLEVKLAGSSAHFELASRYQLRGHDLLDVNHVVRQRGRLTRADITTTGILADAAHKTMRETIDLIHGAKGATGSEVETVLVAGDDVVNKTLPVVLCDEEDVAATHGASIGAVSPEQLAYLATRGLTEADAEELVVRAIFDDALIHAKLSQAKQAVLARAAAVLGQEAADEMAELLAANAEEA